MDSERFGRRKSENTSFHAKTRTTRRIDVKSAIGVLVFAVFVFGCIALFTFFNPYLLFTVSSAIFITQASIFLMSLERSTTEDPKPSKWPSLTIMIPAYNASDSIERCIRQVKEMKYPKPFNIVVVEDASKDDTHEKLSKITGIRVIRNEKNMGKAASLNQAIAQCDTELIANIDSDTYPNPDVLEHLVGYFQDPRVASVSTLIVPEKPKNLLQRIQEFEYYVSFGFWHKSLEGLEGLYVTPGPMTVYRTAALRDVSGFEEGNITEDMEVALALQDKGWRIRTSVNAIVRTEVPGKIRQYFKQRVRWYRGKIFNGFKYKHILFNRFYSHFGMFVFPVTFLVEFLSMVVFFGFITINAKRFLIDAQVFLKILANNAFRLDLIFNFDPLAVPAWAVFLIVTVLIYGYLLYKSMSFAGRKLKAWELPVVGVYLIAYSFFITTSYTMSFFKELSRSEREW